MEYSEFSSKCLNELYEKQELFWVKYGIDKYNNWFYDQASGILTLYKSNDEINFRYKQIGTFSEIEKTWKWSWDNDHTLEKVKSGVELVKEFGQENGFERLTEGTFESSWEEGKELTSIAFEVLGGNGFYIPLKDKLASFLILFEEVEEEQAKFEKSKYVDCENHERRRRAFICQHLQKGIKLGFEESFETYENMEFEYEDDDFQAWCNECEKVRLENDGWNDMTMEFAKIKLVCEKCYFEIKETSKWQKHWTHNFKFLKGGRWCIGITSK